jgi:hypothetical protein
MKRNATSSVGHFVCKSFLVRKTHALAILILVSRLKKALANCSPSDQEKVDQPISFFGPSTFPTRSSDTKKKEKEKKKAKTTALTSKSALNDLPVRGVAQEIRVPRTVRIPLVLVVGRLSRGRQRRRAGGGLVAVGCLTGRHGDVWGRGVDRDHLLLGRTVEDV